MDTGSFPDDKKCGPSSSNHTKGIHNNDIGIQFVHQSNGLDRHEFFECENYFTLTMFLSNLYILKNN
jgi:hypothetical protein